jgi:hypothetical protein
MSGNSVGRKSKYIWLKELKRQSNKKLRRVAGVKQRRY